tara:strand:+ start:243 stop:968 length:726 start_codon:yes stop_codon:yes gene_type:complete
MVNNTKEHKKNTKEHKKSTKEHKKNTKEHKKSEKNCVFLCNFCGGEFSSYATKRRHELHYCKENISIKNKDILKLKNEFKQEKKELKKQINLLITKVGNTTITNNTNNIQLNSYGKEDMSHITDTFKTKMIKIPYGAIPKMIEEVHFNENKPENKNILLTNKSDNKIKVFSGNKWVYKNKDEILNNLIDGKYFLIDSHYETICTKIKNLNYEDFRDKFDDQDKDVINQIKKESELVLLNNR